MTDRIAPLEIPLSAKLVETSRSQFFAETNSTDIVASDGREILLLSDRTQLLISGSRAVAGINGVACKALSGAASTPLSTLFSTVDATAVTTQFPGRPTFEDVPFRVVNLKYSNWDSSSATVTFARPSVFCVDGEKSWPVSLAFFTPQAKGARIAASEPALKRVYDESWKVAGQIVGQIPNLTKSVMSVPYGLNGSGFILSAAANDAPASAPPEVIESLMASALKVDDEANLFDTIMKDLSEPSYSKALKHGERLTCALSAAVAFAMPYRVDGNVTILPTGLAMTQSECWKLASDSAFGETSDDCEGSARFMATILATADAVDASGADMDKFPVLRAYANWHKHFVTGLTVLAANAGNADAANEAATTLAGHCILSAIPKYEVLRARSASLDSGMGVGESLTPAVTAQHAADVLDATFEALYPASLVEQLPAIEKSSFASYAELESLHEFIPDKHRDDILLIEGTAWASTRAYTRDAKTRQARMAYTAASKLAQAKFEPNIARGAKTLDVGQTAGKHAFYETLEEIGVSTKHPLFTSPRLRELGVATTNLRVAQMDTVLTKSGATPAQLSRREFALAPLFTVGVEDGASLDEALEEALANTMPMRQTRTLTPTQTANYAASMAALDELAVTLATRDDSAPTGVMMPLIVPWAALIGNPSSVVSLCNDLAADSEVRGDIYGGTRPILGMARDAHGEELGRLVSIEVQRSV